MKMVDFVLKEKLKIKAKLNYYQFQNAFVIFLLGQPKNPHYSNDKPPVKLIFRLGKKLEFRQFTLGESNIFKDKILTKKINILSKKEESSIKIIQINQNKFFIFFIKTDLSSSQFQKKPNKNIINILNFKKLKSIKNKIKN